MKNHCSHGPGPWWLRLRALAWPSHRAGCSRAGGPIPKKIGDPVPMALPAAVMAGWRLASDEAVGERPGSTTLKS
jgi:hypothetical protein